MAKIFPFRALRYDPARVCLPQVVTQPYDKITPEMQERYYSASPYNLVRIILGKRAPEDDGRYNIYTRAASSFGQWRREGVLRADPEPAVYVYSQSFDDPHGTGGHHQRSGFIALGKIEDYQAGVVFRHEQTLAKPKADRLELLRATRAHFGQIFMLYRNEASNIADVLRTASEQSPADIDLRDEYGVHNRVWRVSNSSSISQLQSAMSAKKLVIADGHHRYETALTYRNEWRAATGHADPNASHERVMMTFFDAHSPGILILPTHRVVFGLANFEPGAMVAAARSFYAVRDLSRDFNPEHPTALLPKTPPGETAMLAVAAKSAFLFQASPGTRHPAFEGISAHQAELDVLRLHKVVLAHVLGISDEAVREQRNIEYLRDPREAVQRVRAGAANVAFLLNPVHIDQMTEIAMAGEVLPQKSTDFYPKLLSGLTIYALD
jgi:uncharacterized protein (DUF1015 family)